MTIVSNILVAFVALLHAYFLVLEMFLWTRPTGLRTFRNSQAQADATRALAANQGLYNGFLAAGLLWSLFALPPQFAFELKLFFLGCVIVAALYGAYSVSRRIFYIQGIPAILALIVTLIFATPYMIPPV